MQKAAIRRPAEPVYLRQQIRQGRERLVWREPVNKKPPSGGRDGSPLRSKSAILVALLPIGEVSRSDGGGWTYLHKKGVHICEPLSCGDGRTRTAVQPNHQYAFYMLILSLVVGKRLPKDRPPQTYPLGLGVL